MLVTQDTLQEFMLLVDWSSFSFHGCNIAEMLTLFAAASSSVPFIDLTGEGFDSTNKLASPNYATNLKQFTILDAATVVASEIRISSNIASSFQVRTV